MKEYKEANFLEILEESYNNHKREIEDFVFKNDVLMNRSFSNYTDEELIVELESVVDYYTELKPIFDAMKLEYEGIKKMKSDNKAEHVYIPEDDFEDEVSISIPKKEKIVAVKDASKTLINSLEDRINMMRKEGVDYLNFKVENGASLCDLARSIYGNPKFWEAIYDYGLNKEIIERMLLDNDLDIEEFINVRGILKNVTLMIPRKVSIEKDYQRSK